MSNVEFKKIDSENDMGIPGGGGGGRLRSLPGCVYGGRKQTILKGLNDRNSYPY